MSNNEHDKTVVKIEICLSFDANEEELPSALAGISDEDLSLLQESLAKLSSAARNFGEQLVNDAVPAFNFAVPPLFDEEDDSDVYSLDADIDGCDCPYCTNVRLSREVENATKTATGFIPSLEFGLAKAASEIHLNFNDSLGKDYSDLLDLIIDDPRGDEEDESELNVTDTITVLRDGEFQAMLDWQYELTDSLNPKGASHLFSSVGDLQQTIQMLIVEASEALAPFLNATKPWKPDVVDLDEVDEEMIDVLHFLLTYFNFRGLDAKDVILAYRNKNLANFNRASEKMKKS